MTAVLALLLALTPRAVYAAQRARAQSRGGKAAPAPKEKAAETPAEEVARLRAELMRATREYKSSLEQLRALYEVGVKRADERVTKTRELYKAGLVSKRELESDEGDAALARAKVAGVEGQLKNADVQIAETLLEAEAEEALAKAQARARREQRRRAPAALVTTTAYVRYGGARAWSLSEAGAVMQFFSRSFGRQLPVSSFGQSPVHDRWGFAHHNAMDVGVHPDSVEGRALLEFLRANGIPFTAFRFAIPGTSTAPHIHIGRPSHRIAPR